MAVSPARKDCVRILSGVFIAVLVNTIIEVNDLFSPLICGITKAIPALFCAYSAIRMKMKAEKKKKIRHHAPAKFCLPIALVPLLLDCKIRYNFFLFCRD